MCSFILEIITCPDIMYETLVTSQQLHGAATVRNFQGWALANNLMNLYCEKVESLCLIKHQAINTHGGVEVSFHQCFFHIFPFFCHRRCVIFAGDSVVK